MVESRARLGSLHRPPSGICLRSRFSYFRLEAEERELTVSASDPEEEMKVENHKILFSPCIWINFPFTRLGVLAEGSLAAATAASEAEGGCLPGGAVVGGEVGSNGLCHHHHIGLVRRSGGNAVI